MRFAWPIVLLLAPPASAQQGDSASAAREFKFQGVGLSTTIDAFHRRYPTAALSAEGCDKSANVLVYLVLGGRSSLGTYSFVDGKLYEIQILYDDATLTKMGGYRVPFDKLVEKFGYASDANEKDNSANATWNFPEVDRRIQCAEVGGTGCLVTITDIKAEEEILRRKEKAADLGF